MPGPSPFMRTRLESWMTDKVTITHNDFGDRDAPMDPDTGKPLTDPTPATTVYIGKALFKPGSERSTEEGENPLGIGGYTLLLPLSAPVPSDGDVVTVNTCRLDPALEDRTMTVDATSLRSYPICRSVNVVERVAEVPHS